MVCFKKLRQAVVPVSIDFLEIDFINYYKLADLDLTMLRQACRRGRLEAFLHENNTGNDLDMELAMELQKAKGSKQNDKSQILSDVEVANALGQALKLSDFDYTLLLEYLHSVGQPWRPHYDIPHPDNALILPQLALKPTEIMFNSYTFSCQGSHLGNSAIQFYIPGHIDRLKQTGFIKSIWKIPLQYLMRTFLLVESHKLLTPEEEQLTPYPSLTHLSSRVVDLASSKQLYIIELHHIITHLTVYKRPTGLYGIPHETMVICWSLNRGRR